MGATLGIDYISRSPVREAKQKIEEGDYGYAVTVLNEYLISYPNDKVALSLKGRAHAGLNEFDKSRKIYETIDGGFELEDLFAFAKSLTVLSEYNDAYNNWIGVISKINAGELDSTPTKKEALMTEALYFMAVCQVQLGKTERALETANDLLTLESQRLQGHYLKGLIEAKRGKEGLALIEWNKVLELDPDVSELKIPKYLFYYEAGVLNLEEGNPEEGIKLLDKSLESNSFEDIPVGAQSLEAMGQAYQELGNQEQAIFYWTKLLQYEQQFNYPTSYIAREGLANYALLAKQPNEAMQLLLPLAAGQQRSSTTYMMQRAHAMAGNEKQALEFKELTAELRTRETKINTIRKAIQARPDTYWAVVLRAFDFATDKNWEEAAQLLISVDENLTDEFSLKLKKAIMNRSALPSLTEIPLDIF